MPDTNVFLITREWRDTERGVELVLWGSSGEMPVRVIIERQKAVCFTPRDSLTPEDSRRSSFNSKPVKLTDLSGADVDALYFNSQRNLREFAGRSRVEGRTLFETDIKPVDRYLMERFITASFRAQGQPRQRKGFIEIRNPHIKTIDFKPPLDAISFDLETSGDGARLFSIAVAGAGGEAVFMNRAESPGESGLPITWCNGEREVLRAFFDWIAAADPDFLIGWNVINFDIEMLDRYCRRLGVPLRLGRGGQTATVLQPDRRNGVRVVRIPGRVVVDGIEGLRSAFWSFESFALENVAQQLLGRGKTIKSQTGKVEEIERLYNHDPIELARYNLEDTRLVNEIFDSTRLLDFFIERARLTGLALGRQGGSVAAFDTLYLPRLHRHGYVAPDTAGDSSEASPGGYVMDSKPGLYRNVLLLDFKSLYPSIIRTFHIDPLGLAQPGNDPVPGFSGATFNREASILPDLIESLWSARDEAKRDNNAPLSQAIKIIMNSFYGVLGANGCRFFDPRLASSITRRGHEIIQKSRDFFESKGLNVIYGDTDSVFVWLGDDVESDAARSRGRALADELTGWWADQIQTRFRLASYLELEFESCFDRFYMPTVRGSEKGSKKRYAGWIAGRGELVVKGLESVRTDWTPLAREFQTETLKKIFTDQPLETFVRDTVSRMWDGKLDDKLVYRKRIRRNLEDYKKNVPPHIQAARKLDKAGRFINYVITAQGPEPVMDGIPKPDYNHYRDRQLKPAVDGMLKLMGLDFDQLVDGQLGLWN